jgi:hypothetical protein
MVLSGSAATSKADNVDLQEDETPKVKAKAKSKPPVDLDLDEDDESLSYFAKLANSD